MASGAPDWERVVTLVAPSMTAGAPDWERTVVGPGGTSVGGYASLTGAGQTVTPGTLTQAGRLNVDGELTAVTTTSGFAFFVSGSGSSGVSISVGTGGVNLASTGILTMQSTATSAGVKVQLLIPNGIAAGGILIHNAGTGDIEITADTGPVLVTGASTGSTNGGIVETVTGALGNGLALALEGGTVQLFTGTDLAALSTPIGIAFGLTQDGHIYFYPSGGPWALMI